MKTFKEFTNGKYDSPKGMERLPEETFTPLKAAKGASAARMKVVREHNRVERMAYDRKYKDRMRWENKWWKYRENAGRMLHVSAEITKGNTSMPDKIVQVDGPRKGSFSK